MKTAADLVKIIFLLVFIAGWLFLTLLPFVAAGVVAYIGYHFVVKYW